MKNKLLLSILLLVCLLSSGCAPQPAAAPTPLPPTASPALDADTLYDMLIKAIQGSDEKEVARLIAAKAPIDRGNEMGITPLMIAAITDDAEIVGLLLKAGADPETYTLAGLNALILAAQLGKANAIRALVEGGAQVDSVDKIPIDGFTPLTYAISRRQPEAVRALIDVGADINQRIGKNKETPVIAAVRTSFIEAARMFIDAGADLTLRSNEGKTALDYAKELKDTEMVALLEAAGAV
jgi:ankyrin repeat protein